MLVNDFLSRSAEQYGDKVAIVCEGKRFSYQAVEERANQIAHALIKMGVKRGDRVALFLDNSIEMVESIFGILKAGAIFVVVNTQTKEDKVSFMLNNCEAVSMIIDSQYQSILQAVTKNVKSLRGLLMCGTSHNSVRLSDYQTVYYHNDLTTYSKMLPIQRCIDMDVAAIIYTSGSTGRPKGVTVTHLNMVSAATSITQYLENKTDDVILNVLPISFDYGLYQVLMSVKVSATLILEKTFTFPYEMIQRIKEERVTGFPGVPTIFSLLLDLKQLDPADLQSVRYLSNTGAALPTTHITRLQSMFTNARVFSMYGITECKRVSYLPPEELSRRPTSVGRGMPNEEVYIVDEYGELVSPGEIGELVVRGSNVMQGYWGMPEENERVLRPGRYPGERVLYTGDLFRMDDDGFLYFVSRKDNIIKCRGEKVSPREVENVIYELTDVQEVAVVGVPDSILGHAIHAYVVLSSTSDLDEKMIIAHCAKKLENFMVPKSVFLCNALPKTTSGKIQVSNIVKQSNVISVQEG